VRGDEEVYTGKLCKEGGVKLKKKFIGSKRGDRRKKKNAAESGGTAWLRANARLTTQVDVKKESVKKGKLELKGGKTDQLSATPNLKGWGKRWAREFRGGQGSFYSSSHKRMDRQQSKVRVDLGKIR